MRTYSSGGHPSALTSIGVMALAALGFWQNAAVASELDVLLFGSVDSSSTTFVTQGVKIAPNRFDQSGAVGLIAFGGGTRFEKEPTAKNGFRSRKSSEGSAVLGYQWISDRGVVALYAGPEVITDQRFGSGPATRPGARLLGEAWLRPTDETLFQATILAHSTRRDFWARTALGYRLWGVYYGPEISGSYEMDGYAKAAVGLHATDFTIMDLHFRTSAGVQWENSRSSLGPYLSVASWMPL